MNNDSFIVGDWLVKPSNNLLINKEIERRIEPKLMSLLVCLAQAKGNVVSRDSLLSAVWQQVVLDDALNNAIAQLRKALGDSQSPKQYIETIPKQGYRLVANVSQPENTVGYFSKKMLLAVGFLTIIICSGVGYLLISNNKIEISSPSVQNTDNNMLSIVGILPMSVKSNDPQLSILAVAISDYLGNRLSSGLGVSVIHPESISALTQENDDIWAIQALTQANYLIQWDIEKTTTTNSARLNITLHSVFNDNQLTPISLGDFDVSLPNTTEGLLDMFQKRQVLVKNILRLIRPGIVIKDYRNAETKSPEAFRLVIAAHRLIRLGDCKMVQRIDELLQKAIAIDPNFSYAWRVMYGNHYRRVWMCGDSIEFHEKALQAAAMADKLSPGLYDVLITGQIEILTESNRVEKAYGLIGPIADSDIANQNVKTLNRAVYALRYAGFLNQSTKMMDVILQRAPLNYSGRPVRQSPNVYLYQNQFEQYLSQLTSSGYIYHDYYRGLVAYFQNNKRLARQQLSQILTKSSDNLFKRYAQALLYIVKEEPQKAIDEIEKISKQQTETGNIDGEMSYKQAQLMAMAGNDEQALKLLALSLEQGFFNVSYFLSDPALASLRQYPLYREIVINAAKRHLAFANQFGLTPELPNFDYGIAVPNLVTNPSG